MRTQLNSDRTSAVKPRHRLGGDTVGPLEPSRRDRQYPTEVLRIPYGSSPNLLARTWLVPLMYLACAWLEDGPGCDCFHQVPSFGKAESGRSSCATLQPVSDSLRQH